MNFFIISNLNVIKYVFDLFAYFDWILKTFSKKYGKILIKLNTITGKKMNKWINTLKF